MTPADIEIANLRRSIVEAAESNAALQQRWLSQQRELVAQEKACGICKRTLSILMSNVVYCCCVYTPSLFSMQPIFVVIILPISSTHILNTF